MRRAVQNGWELFQYASGDASLKVENDIQTLIHCSQISVVQIFIHPPKNHIDFFSRLHFPMFLSPGYKSSHAIGRINEGCIWYCYKSLINQAGLGVSHCLLCHVAAASIFCGQPGQKFYAGGSAVEGTDRRLLGCKTGLSWQCFGSQIHYKAWFINLSSLLKTRPLVWPLYVQLNCINCTSCFFPPLLCSLTSDQIEF